MLHLIAPNAASDGTGSQLCGTTNGETLEAREHQTLHLIAPNAASDGTGSQLCGTTNGETLEARAHQGTKSC